MATYSRLLLKDGGGVIDPYQLNEQSNCATIAIGLGGTGVACLKEFRKKVYTSLCPDDFDVSFPQYKHIKFLAVDRDRKSLETDRSFCSLDEEDEYFDLRDDEAVQKWQGTMKDTCDRLLEIFSDRYLGLLQQQATKLSDCSNGITSFLFEFRQGIDNFMLMYGIK